MGKQTGCLGFTHRLMFSRSIVMQSADAECVRWHDMKCAITFFICIKASERDIHWPRLLYYKCWNVECEQRWRRIAITLDRRCSYYWALRFCFGSILAWISEISLIGMISAVFALFIFFYFFLLCDKSKRHSWPVQHNLCWWSEPALQHLFLSAITMFCHKLELNLKSVCRDGHEAC